ncbi:hypothetical protein ERO13_D11G339000v2 [Gossypium hirsutum]|uniref:Uncharacterized protein n=1 Tax=Gossypium hirsutum TaxID=3635 RepID=A0A1U8NTQ7_GOSHI|nr:uncharacterized protein LOC107951720 [Gossypium hirsutum]XP_016742348.2 uncharacterized protein LOC107951720 [Gossypium hirsutum]KAG4123638.1 hypothetical protein ERO13_D11G339000v2 [Gossypium hirsutum]
MSSDDSLDKLIKGTFVDPSPENSLELREDLRQVGIPATEAQIGANVPPLPSDDNQVNSLSLMSSSRTKRNLEFVFDNFSGDKGEEKKQRRGGFYIGESSNPQQQRGAGSKEEDLSELEMAKAFKDRINSQIKMDDMAYMESVIWIFHQMIEMKASALLPKVLGSLKQIKSQCPVRSDLDDIKRKVLEIELEFKDTGLTNEAKWRLLELEEEFKRLDKKWMKDLTKAVNLDAIFTNNMYFSVETLRKELLSACPWIDMKKLL